MNPLIMRTGPPWKAETAVRMAARRIWRGKMLVTLDGHDKVQAAIQRLKSFEPEEGYYLAFSGGKDSQCIYHLCQMAGVKFDAHYSVVGVDPPELVQFIKDHYPDVKREIPHDADGKPITMWNLIPKKLMPPTRMVRYCCEKLKESGGVGRVTVTGVRWEESVRRKNNQGVAVVQGASKKEKAEAENAKAKILKNSIVLNNDNEESRRLVETCYNKRKTLVNPIIDWEEEDVWEFLNEVAKVPHCELYDRGYRRLGCIGYPMSGNQEAELSAYPAFRKAYLRAFDRMLKVRAVKGSRTDWKTPEEVMQWWLQKDTAEAQIEGQISMDELEGL